MSEYTAEEIRIKALELAIEAGADDLSVLDTAQDIENYILDGRADPMPDTEPKEGIIGFRWHGKGGEPITTDPTILTSDDALTKEETADLLDDWAAHRLQVAKSEPVVFREYDAHGNTIRYRLHNGTKGWSFIYPESDTAELTFDFSKDQEQS
jgi:hypothetical protein